MKRRGRRLAAVLLACGFALVAAALAAPRLVPAHVLRAQAEMLLSAAVHRPTHVERAEFRLLPLPRIHLRGVQFDGGRSEPPVTVARIDISPDLLAPLRGGSLLRLRATDVSLPLSVLSAALFPRPGAVSLIPAMPFGVRDAGIRGLHLTTGAAKAFGPYDVDVRLTERSQLEALSIARTDGRLHIDMTPQGYAMRVRLRAHRWRLPVGPQIRCDALTAEGVLRGPQLRVDHAAGHCFGGTVHGDLWVGWGEQWTAESHLRFARVDTRELMAALAARPVLEGLLHGRAHVILDARDPQDLFVHPIVEADFTVADGTLRGADLAAATSAPSNRPQHGGRTAFARLQAHVALQLGAVHVTGLRLTAPRLAASGRFRVDGRRLLAGHLEVRPAGVPGGSATRVRIGGVLARPTLTRSAKSDIAVRDLVPLLGVASPQDAATAKADVHKTE